MKTLFDNTIERRGTDSIKWHYYDPDVLPLWVADMDFAAPQVVIEALQKRVAHGIFGYAGTQLIPDLYESIQAQLQKMYNWTVDQESILFLPGVVVGFNLACHASGSAGDEVLMQPPVYYPFLTAPGNAQQTVRYAQVTDDNGRYEVDLDAFESAISENTSLFILCNPHNPIGRVYKEHELEAMAEICLRHGVTICSDEIHCDLVYPGHRHTPIAAISKEIAAQTITLMAPSKTFNVPGLGCSFAIVQNPELRERFTAARQGLVSHVNLLGYTAAAAAYRDGHAWLTELLVYLQANRDYVCQYVETQMPGIRVRPPEGTYLAWLDCRSTPFSDAPAQFFLEQARVGLNEGAKFGPGGEGFARLNFACPRQTLDEALERMRQAYEKVCG